MHDRLGKTINSNMRKALNYLVTIVIQTYRINFYSSSILALYIASYTFPNEDDGELEIPVIEVSGSLYFILPINHNIVYKEDSLSQSPSHYQPNPGTVVLRRKNNLLQIPLDRLLSL